MFDWLFEGRPLIYALVGVAAVAFLVLWWQSRKRGLLLAAGVMVILAAVVFLLDWSVETDREQIRGKVESMAAAVTAHHLDEAFQHVSDQFRTPRGTDKKALRALAQRYRDSDMVNEVTVWDIRVTHLSRQQGQARVSFRVKVKPVQAVDLRCDAVFDHDAAHGWRLQTFRLFNPYREEEWSTPF